MRVNCYNYLISMSYHALCHATTSGTKFDIFRCTPPKVYSLKIAVGRMLFMDSQRCMSEMVQGRGTRSVS